MVCFSKWFVLIIFILSGRTTGSGKVPRQDFTISHMGDEQKRSEKASNDEFRVQQQMEEIKCGGDNKSEMIVKKLISRKTQYYISRGGSKSQTDQR